MSLKGRFVHNTIPNGIVRKFQFLQFRSNKGEEVSTSQRLSNPSNRGIGFQCQEKSRATYSLPRRGGGDRNEKTVCNTRYQPRNCRGAEREREIKTGVTGLAREKLSKIKFFSFFWRLNLFSLRSFLDYYRFHFLNLCGI